MWSDTEILILVPKIPSAKQIYKFYQMFKTDCRKKIKHTLHSQWVLRIYINYSFLSHDHLLYKWALNDKYSQWEKFHRGTLKNSQDLQKVVFLLIQYNKVLLAVLQASLTQFTVIFKQR